MTLAPRIALLLVLALPLGLPLSGCMTDEDDRTNGITDTIDAFPRPLGPRILPLEGETRADYRFAELDSARRPLQRLPQLPLVIRKRSGDTFTYAFEDTSRGYLIRYRDPGPRDSAGVYLLGSYDGPVADWYADPILWLPQFPTLGATWPVGAGRSLEAVSLETFYFTEPLFAGDSAAPVVQGFQRHSAILLKETAGGVVTHWWLRKGVGILGFQRSAGGRLLASGTLGGIYTVRRYADR